LRVHLKIQQEPDFLKHITVEQMGLVNDNNRQETVDTLHNLNFFMELAFCLTAIILCATGELLQQSSVEKARGHF
jgi:hypothetical protein